MKTKEEIEHDVIVKIVDDVAIRYKGFLEEISDMENIINALEYLEPKAEK